MKRLNKALLLVLVLSMLFTSVASASPLSIKNGVALTLVTQMVRATNQTIEAMVKAAQRTPYDDVAYLLAATNLIAKNTITYAASLGILVECEYKTYWVDGRKVDIDPLRVIGPRT